MNKEKQIIKEKKKEFDEVFIKKAEELDKKIEKLWSKIISEEKLINIFEDREDFVDTLGDMKLNKFDNGDGYEVVFKFTQGLDFDYIHLISLENNGKVKYTLLDSYLDKDKNEDMLNPVTDREWEEDMDFSVRELVKRQLDYVREKREFLIFTKTHGQEIFDKYYSHIMNRINRNVEYIDNMIEEMMKW